MGTLRKALDALKDSATVGIANLSSDFKELDVAIVKATNHVESPPKEQHLKKILAATSIDPRHVEYCIEALSKRLAKTHNWTVALKTLIVIHKNLKEGNPKFRAELLDKGHVLQLSNFKDDSSPIAWDCSACVRTYALFLEERLECFKILKYDVGAECLKITAQGAEKGHSRTSELDIADLLEQLPALQQLLYRLIGCRPEGDATGNSVVQYALALVMAESFKIYCAIHDGIINLIDKFFEMPRHEAIRALEIYKRARQQARSLSDFYAVCQGLDLARNLEFPDLREPPQASLFIAAMEKYIREAPRVVSNPMDLLEKVLLTYKPDEASSSIDEENPSLINGEPALDYRKSIPFNAEVASPCPLADTEDLLGLNTINPDAIAIEESNALALGIASSSALATCSAVMQEKATDPLGWEFVLVSAPSSISTVETQLGGGFDRLTLYHLYDEADYRRQQQQQQQQYLGTTPAPNPFMTNNPFSVSGQVAALPAVQTAAMAQQQAEMMPAPGSFGQPMPPQQLVFNRGASASGSNPSGDTTGFGEFPNLNDQPYLNNPFGDPLL